MVGRRLSNSTLCQPSVWQVILYASPVASMKANLRGLKSPQP
eukprot:COSAG04_NODE_5350_length_1646_cov_1.592114_2_plen_41_part_01